MSVTKSVSSHSFRMSDGDWVCDDQNCQNINFARRMNCNICGKDKPNESKHSSSKEDKTDKKRKIGHEIGKVAAEKSKGLFSADDWQCGRCGNVNWARRQTCNMCNAPKFGDNEERTGLGGGYNEREEHVEYIEREESDSEYDDFGRKKKKLRKTSEKDRSDDSSGSSDSKHKPLNKNYSKKDINSSHKSDTNKDIKHNESTDDDNDEGEGEDLSKYKLDSDEREEEDSETGDVSKYKLDSEEDEEEDSEAVDVSKYKLDSEEDEEEDSEGGDVSKYKLDSESEEDSDEDLSKYDLSDCGNKQ